MGNPKKAGPGFIRTALATWYASALASATVAPDFASAGAATIFGGSAGFTVPHWFEVEKLRLVIGNTDWVQSGGTLTFVLRKGSTSGDALATLTVAVADAVRGAVLEATVSAANDEIAKLRPTDKLFITRTATGTAFTTGDGTWAIIGRQLLQSKGV